MSPISNSMCAFATSPLKEYIIPEVLLKSFNLKIYDISSF